MIFVAYDTATGAAESIASGAPETLPAHLAAYSLDVPYSALNGYEWDAATRTLVVRTASLRYNLTKLEFASRLSLPEQVAIEMAKESADPQTRATLRVLDANLNRSSEVVLTDERTIQGAQIIVSVLVGAGLVTAPNAAARIAALLSPVAVEAP